MRFPRSFLYTVCVLLFLTVVAEASILAYQHRVELIRYVWEEHRLFPEVALQMNQSAALAFEIGNYYFNWHRDSPEAYDVAKAKRFYTKAYELDPDRSGVRYQLGRVEFLSGNFAEAILHLSAYIHRYEGTEDYFLRKAYYMRGLVHAYAREFRNAERDFKALFGDDDLPQTWATYVDLSWVYLRWGKFSEARELMEHGAEAYPENPWILAAYGTALLNTEEYKKAETVLTKAKAEAAKLTPEDWAAAYPGNHPEMAAPGLEKMRGIIEKNRALASAAVDK